MAKDQKEWFKQADYDIDTAQALFDSKRYIYAVFMCHLSLEKALKGLYFKKLGQHAPKTHNLLYLIQESEIECPASFEKFINRLNRESIVPRYPEDISRMSKNYNDRSTGEIISKSKEVLEWLREKL